MSKAYFVSGTGTEVGKTVVSAHLQTLLDTDYWKPVQAGDLDFGTAPPGRRAQLLRRRARRTG